MGTADKNLPKQVSCSEFLAVNEIKTNESKLSLYPNPAKDKVYRACAKIESNQSVQYKWHIGEIDLRF